MSAEGNEPKVIPEEWEYKALLNKSVRYYEEMLKHSHDDWQFVFWSSLSLELLARSALAKVSPALLADPKDWNNLLFSLGHTPKANKFVPKSIDISTVFSRLKEMTPNFTQELEGFCLIHMSRRNEELHSGTAPFDSLNPSSWLPTYYQACKVLVFSLGESLSGLIGEEESNAAEAMIVASLDEAAKAITKTIQAHRTVWVTKDTAERETLVAQALTWATKQNGHRVKCPACDSDSLLAGDAIAAPLKTIKEHEITETQEYLPSKFECVACGLKISGLSHLNACGLGDTFKATFTYDAADYYYSPDDEHAEYEPDFNEP